MHSLLAFKPIDLTHHAEICIQFREDSFKESFGSTEGFYEADRQGHQRYLIWLETQLKNSGSACLHVWLGSKIIGQIELTTKTHPAHGSIGYVNLFYLRPEYRGRGYAQPLNDYSESFFRKQGLSQLYLSVSPKNTRALAFYKKQGWVAAAPLSPRDNVIMLKKKITKTSHHTL